MGTGREDDRIRILLQPPAAYAEFVPKLLMLLTAAP